MNNRGFGLNSDFDGMQHYFSCPELSDKNQLHVGSVPFRLGMNAHQQNEVTARGQVITLATQESASAIGAVYLLVSVSHGPVAVPLTLTYQDGSSSTTLLDIPDWKLTTPKHHITRLDPLICQTNGQPEHGFLFLAPLAAEPSKRLSYLTMPATYPIGWMAPALHMLAITTFPATSKTIRIVSVQPSSELHHEPHQSYRLLRIRLHNIGPEWLHRIRIENAGQPLLPFDALTSVPNQQAFPFHQERLAPGQLAHVRVAVPVDLAGPLVLSVTASTWLGLRQRVSSPATFTFSLEPDTAYDRDPRHLQRHEAPTWFRDSKFGIFIHWGAFSVPAWAPVGQTYAEWYWWDLMHANSPTQQHHRDTFGTDVAYDAFFSLWKPTAFDPYHWLDLVDQAKARYFVFTTKHHDGLALFDTKVTNRSTVHFHQQRDFVGDLMQVAERSYPHLRRGLYFSMPEWFHPAYRDDGLGWHGPPINPFTNEKVPYTGSRAITDFVNELQVPQALELIDQYHPEIFWCDIGGINNSSVWQTPYFNGNNSVTVNDRCGNGVSDFDTIEYREVYHTPARFWEATRGMDPYSFGYNQATQPEQYASTTQLIHELINTIVRGGNFLLNIGPESSGQVPMVMQQRLREMGDWLTAVGPSIFDSVPFWATPQDHHTPGQQLRFACHRQGTACYVFALEPPNQRIDIRAPLPYHANALIRLMQDPLHEPLSWKRWSSRQWTIQVPLRVIEHGQHAWVFEIRYP
ncbi:glycoside hydrolase [Hesseltinella vesiculosa]|uniref:alpha-L-fucosidase n=1 Tax=Hesseltinella vesiculosa TaxID=101127 RepID=A0A1X2GQK3_9FUNG|nr:glycoside hydrolase [Hesseltinella vesiculosa]